MERWFTSDLHIGHARIIELCNRPFSDVNEMNEALVENWNGRIGPEDSVFVLGDVALGKLDESLAVVKQLNGRKYLVPGNHDRCWSGNKKVRPADRSRYEDTGFTILGEQVQLVRDWWMCHFPVHGDSYTDDRYPEYRPSIGPDEWLIHGHVHNMWKTNGRQINVGVDVWDYRPVHEDELVALTK